eukprot:TRINITY_DN31577_c0_g1_i1.p1 TRINITY_DN31577_c0_g1~~TRINITY_DN31577_c0_g1_i1.p1  ORF type:complete len:519 (+),score=78.86 TRINITY_DN31577_c0_g1_i1:102-1658(+)
MGRVWRRCIAWCSLIGILARWELFVEGQEENAAVPCPICGSEGWSSCGHANMEDCEEAAGHGDICCCKAGFVYDAEQVKCVAGVCDAPSCEQAGDADGCPICGSEAWSSCHHANMGDCGDICCCKSGFVFDAEQLKCVEGECLVKSCGEDANATCPICGSEGWSSCQHANMGDCGDMCCCKAGFVFDAEQLKCLEGECLVTSCGEEANATCPICGSEGWSTCKHTNMGDCAGGGRCCCVEGFNFDAEQLKCVEGECLSPTCPDDLPTATAPAVATSLAATLAPTTTTAAASDSAGTRSTGSTTVRQAPQTEIVTTAASLAGGCPIPGSHTWDTCEHDHMVDCNGRCCCESGYVYSMSAGGCIAGECPEQTLGPPIVGSESWSSCNHDRMQTCGARCCCDFGTAFNKAKLACMPIEAQHLNQTEQGEIRGSENWFSCWHSNIQQCGNKCCCEAGTLYVQFDEDNAQCVLEALVPKVDLGPAEAGDAPDPAEVLDSSGDSSEEEDEQQEEEQQAEEPPTE